MGGSHRCSCISDLLPSYPVCWRLFRGRQPVAALEALAPPPPPPSHPTPPYPGPTPPTPLPAQPTSPLPHPVPPHTHHTATATTTANPACGAPPLVSSSQAPAAGGAAPRRLHAGAEGASGQGHAAPAAARRRQQPAAHVRVPAGGIPVAVPCGTTADQPASQRSRLCWCWGFGRFPMRTRKAEAAHGRLAGLGPACRSSHGQMHG